MGTRLSRSGSSLSLLPDRQRSERREEDRDSDNESLDGLGRREDIAQFPYVEFTGRDSITCATCQGTGRIPSDQVNELVALIPYNDQRLQPQRTKLYVVLSVVLCLLASSLVAFFLFPRAVIVADDGIHTVTVLFDHVNMKVYMNMTSTLNLTNPNFFSVLVQSLSCQVLYMKTVIGTQLLNNATTIQPLSESQVNYTVGVEIGSSAPYVYAFCTMPSIKVHNIVVYMHGAKRRCRTIHPSDMLQRRCREWHRIEIIKTSVKTSYMVRTSQNSLEAYRYIDCGSNTTYHQRAKSLFLSPPLL